MVTKTEEKVEHQIVTLVDVDRYTYRGYVFKRDIPVKVKLHNAAYLLSQENEEGDRYFIMGTPEDNKTSSGKKKAGRPAKPKVSYDKVEVMKTSEEQRAEAAYQRHLDSMEGQPESIKEYIKKDWEAKQKLEATQPHIEV
jgi:hypothetical protein